jgi:hypothetical protein
VKAAYTHERHSFPSLVARSKAKAKALADLSFSLPFKFLNRCVLDPLIVRAHCVRTKDDKTKGENVGEDDAEDEEQEGAREKKGIYLPLALLGAMSSSCYNY